MSGTVIESRSAGRAPADAARDDSTPAIRALDVTFGYGSAGDGSGGRADAVSPRQAPVLAGLSLAVEPGEFVAVVGANGSGKSTLLRVLAGLLRPAAGRIEIGGVPISGPDRRIGFVFQEPRLLPWRSVIDNVAFPLELAGLPVAGRTARARDALGLVGLVGVDDERPHRLSGGMRQRAAIARALVREPEILLLDEPFSALDALTRERLNATLQEIWTRTGTSVVLVTHSISEAIFLADRVLVLSRRTYGIVADIAVPIDRPRRLSALDATGVSAAAAVVRGVLEDDDGDVR